MGRADGVVNSPALKVISSSMTVTSSGRGEGVNVCDSIWMESFRRLAEDGKIYVSKALRTSATCNSRTMDPSVSSSLHDKSLDQRKEKRQTYDG